MRKGTQICLILALFLIVTYYTCSGQSNGPDLSNGSPTDFVGDAFNKLKPGWIVSTCPNETKVGSNELVEARIARNITSDLYKDLRGRGRPELVSRQY